MNDLLDILHYIMIHTPKTKSDFSRYYATEIAECASRGFISTINCNNRATNRWRLTMTGMSFIDCTVNNANRNTTKGYAQA